MVTCECIFFIIKTHTLMLAVVLQLLKETAARCSEAAKIKWTDIDFERKIVHINHPAKGSKARTLPISEKLIGMINRQPKKSVKVFATLDSLKSNFYMSRKILSNKLQNPRLMDIHLHTFRHWKATMEYHKTREIMRVQYMLGHRNINCTMIYISLENALFQNTTDDYIVKTAYTIDEATKLLEVGFEYVTKMEDASLFRKRK